MRRFEQAFQRPGIVATGRLTLFARCLLALLLVAAAVLAAWHMGVRELVGRARGADRSEGLPATEVQVR